MTRALRKQMARIARNLDVQTLPAAAATRLVEAGMLEMDRLSASQLGDIANGAEWDFSGLTDGELRRIAAGEAMRAARTSRTGKP